MSKKQRLGRGLVLIAALAFALFYGPTLWAQAHAKWDVAHGNYHITEYGLPPINCAAYQTLLYQRYGVSVSEGGCIVPYNINQLEAYNDVVRESLKHKYHRDIFAECWAASVPLHH